MNVLSRLLDALYPPGLACWACELESDVDAQGLCAACAALLQPVAPLSPPQGLHSLLAGAPYSPFLRPAMYRFKYGNRPDLAAGFASLMPSCAALAPDCLLPVPLWPGRLKQRGYNQSALLAQALVQQQGLNVPILEHLLARTRDTGTQTALDIAARNKNVHAAFHAIDEVKGRRILLIDDVTTTGSTLCACAAALYGAGAASVSACVVCVATRGDDGF